MQKHDFMKNYNGINKLKPYLFLLPILVFACGFVYFPFARTFLYSFSRVNFRGDITGFTGTRNFNRLFGDPVFFTALKNTLTLTFFAVTFNLLISYSLALLANRKRKTSFIYETMFIIPMAVSMPAASQIFKMLLEPAMGIFNYRLGLKIGWFTDPSAALAGIVMVCVWIGIPFDFILFLSGLRNIPSNVMEAADLEGTGKLRRLFKLQLPLTAPTIFYVICTNIVLAMMTSTPVMIITAGQPSHSTTTLIFMMYTSGYQSSNYSIAACISLITFILTFGMVFLAFIFDSRKVHYQ